MLHYLICLIISVGLFSYLITVPIPLHVLGLWRKIRHDARQDPCHEPTCHKLPSIHLHPFHLKISLPQVYHHDQTLDIIKKQNGDIRTEIFTYSITILLRMRCSMDLQYLFFLRHCQSSKTRCFHFC